MFFVCEISSNKFLSPAIIPRMKSIIYDEKYENCKFDIAVPIGNISLIRNAMIAVRKIIPINPFVVNIVFRLFSVAGMKCLIAAYIHEKTINACANHNGPDDLMFFISEKYFM
jgi:hypothetical protein